MAMCTISRGGRSFDLAGYRVRLEAGHGDDRVPELVATIVEAIEDHAVRAGHVEVDGVEWCVTHQGIVDECGPDRSDDDGNDCCDQYDVDGEPCDIRPLYHAGKP